MLRLLSAALISATLAFAPLLLAAEPTATESSEEDPNEDPEPPVVPPAEDSVGGHLALSFAGGWTAPFGDFEGSRDVVDAGPSFTFDATLGVGRAVALGAWGRFVAAEDGDDCSGCSPRLLAGGALVRYHLVQGLRFDPWASAGLGFMTASVADPTGSVSYSGMEWLRLQIGGDWYPVPVVGIGPLLEVSAGTFLSRSDSQNVASAVSATFTAGGRIVIDLPGK